MEPIYFKEVFAYPIDQFKRHLENEVNERIMFSGKYGSGKTRFLCDFFGEGNQKELFGATKYRIYRISPVNYSIATNEDIIRYIKYDIILGMLRNSLTLDEIKISFRKTFAQFASTNSLKIAAALVYMIPKLGKEVVEAFEKIDGLKEEYFKYHDEVNRSKGDSLVEYMEHLEMKSGSIYENDVTTKIIAESIERDEDRKSVLIIDDVDRLDPEHVFRILNVFAAHFDSQIDPTQKNKFNFEKVIIVCDINNIRNIFHHRYGADADFTGYIDKFYSSDIFHFDNKPTLKKVVEAIFASSSCFAMEGDNANIIKQLYFNNGFLETLVPDLAITGYVSLRSMLKFHGKQLPYHYEKVTFDRSNKDITAHICPIIMQIRVLMDLFGDYRMLRKAFERYEFTDNFIENHSYLFGDLIYILSFKEHGFFRRGNEYRFTFDNIPLSIEVRRDFSNDRFQSAQIFNLIDDEKGQDLVRDGLFSVNNQLFKKAFLEVLELLHRIGYLH